MWAGVLRTVFQCGLVYIRKTKRRDNYLYDSARLFSQQSLSAFSERTHKVCFIDCFAIIDCSHQHCAL